MKIFRIFIIFATLCLTGTSAYAYPGRCLVVSSVDAEGVKRHDKKIMRKRDCISMRRRTKITKPEFASALVCAAISGGGVVLFDFDGEAFSLSIKLGDLDDSCQGCRSLSIEPSLDIDGSGLPKELVCRKFSGSGKVLVDKTGNVTAGQAEIKVQNNCGDFFLRQDSDEFIVDIAWAYLE